MGVITGKGVKNTILENRQAPWVYCGVQRYASPPVICQPLAWEVTISGMLECPCPP